jgi:uncharacterized protein (TIGR03437 family)
MRASAVPAVLCLLASFANSQPQPPYYTISTIAGKTPRGFLGDGGLALNAAVFADAMTRDAAGNIYIAELWNGRVRKIAPSGIITSVAGPGVPGFGDRGPGPETPGAIKLSPSAVAISRTDDLFIADQGGNRVIKISASGQPSILAGSGKEASDGDGGPATNASFNIPTGIAVDRQGNVYVAEMYRIRKIAPDGIISTYAGTGVFGFGGDGGPAINAQVLPWVLAVDDAGVLYFSDGGARIRKITPDGVINPFAGTGAFGFRGDGGAATAALLAGPIGISVDHKGNLFIADQMNGRIRKVDSAGIITTIIAPSAPYEAGLVSRSALSAMVGAPYSLLADDSGNVYFTNDYGLSRMDAQGMVWPFAGYPSPGDGGKALDAQFGSPSSATVDSNGNIYISDSSENRVRKIDTHGIITTVAGDGERGYLGDGVFATTALLNNPGGVAVDRAGNLYIADTGNHRIRKVGLDGVIETIAGRGVAGFSGDGGPATAGQLSAPSSVAVDRDGSVYISDTRNNRIRKVSGGVITTIVADDSHQNVSEPAFSGLAVDQNGSLYFGDFFATAVRRLAPDGTISTVATADEPPISLAIDSDGLLFFSSYDGIRRVRGDAVDIIAGAARGDSIDGGPAFAVRLALGAIAAGAPGSLYITEPSVPDLRLTQIAPATGSPHLLGVVNGEALALSPIAPGEVVSLFGTDLGPPTPTNATLDASGKFPAQLAGVTVSFNGIAARLLSVQSNQVDVVVPFAIPTQTAIDVRLVNNGQDTTASVDTIDAAPEIIKLHPSASSTPAAALNQDGSINSPANPAPAGSIVTLFVTGAGAMTPAFADGSIATNFAQPAIPLSTTFGEIEFVGAAPGLLVGIVQMNVRAPVRLPCGQLVCLDPDALPVFVQSGERQSIGIATVAVRFPTPPTAN